MFRLAAVSIFLAVVPLDAAVSQTENEPAIWQVLDRFEQLGLVGRLNTDDADSLFSGELTGERAASFVEITPDKIVSVAPEFAVARVQVSDGGRPVDFYFYLRETGERWTIDAIRALATTGPLVVLKRMLDAKQNLSEEEKTSLRNINLTLSSDAELLRWFAMNYAEIDGWLNGAGPSRARLDELGVTAFNKESDGSARLLVGGLVDNEVGFLYVPDGAPPRIDPSNHIWIEPADGNWFLFKTT